MNLEHYYQESDGFISFSRDSASQFAKQVAGDYNPIHDPESRRFCVPGDLLFACALHKYGLSQHMQFSFSGMVDSGIRLNFSPNSDSTIPITNQDGKVFMTLQRSGEQSQDRDFIANLTQQYVAYSGYTFINLLVPLMKQHDVMINPDRPLVVYESMELELYQLGNCNLSIQPATNRLTVEGKRGRAELDFELTTDTGIIGKGRKSMLLSNLRPYQEEPVQDLVNQLLKAKSADT